MPAGEKEQVIMLYHHCMIKQWRKKSMQYEFIIILWAYPLLSKEQFLLG